MNRTLEKFLSYLDYDNDYNYEIIKNILDKYNHNKNNKRSPGSSYR